MLLMIIQLSSQLSQLFTECLQINTFVSIYYKVAMRYIMKGGVWKNSQDEILKAAIMKYGLNQWSRISSLLQRKSAKQCKQRWYEWLDPSIKKTEWTRAEDEKLLQLSRVFPSQWRTVAPFVGRTPTQCYERYEKLLDMAQGKTLKEAEDLRRLRPGEIDPNPETKPARLDPIDMDEDEKEMLAEVRVRLANTKGKKAKRKEREKIIQEARRLAQLQKIRQLEMAGVENIPTAKEIKRLRQRKTLDYNKEIPFKRDAPEFVYKTEEAETPKNVSFASTITLQTLEGKRRDVEQQLQRKLDRRRMKKFRERDLKSVLQMKNKIARPSTLPINLPEPQINEKDLENMKKFNITTPLNTLLSELPAGMTPENKILYSARVNLSLNHQEMTPSGDELDGIEGLRALREMEKQKVQPMRSLDRVISERMKTPLNEWEDDHRKVKSLFKNLSKPQNVIEFDIPEVQEEDEDEMLLDAEEREKIEKQKQQIQYQKRMELQTEVIKRRLPRPMSIPSNILHRKREEIAKKLIDEEMLSLIYSDALDNPIEGVVFPDNPPAYREEITLEKIEQAKRLINEELQSVKSSLKITPQILEAARRYVQLSFDKKQAKILQNPLSQKEQKALEQVQHNKLNVQQWRSLTRRTEGNEKKTRKLLLGYEKLIKSKIQQINTLRRELDRVQRQRRGLQQLQSQQQGSMQARVGELQAYYRLIYNSI